MKAFGKKRTAVCLSSVIVWVRVVFRKRGEGRGERGEGRAVVIFRVSHDQRHKYHCLMKTLLLTLKMTTGQLVEMLDTYNSLSEDYSHPDDHTRQTTDKYSWVQTIYQ